jgi:hypothetical protein
MSVTIVRDLNGVEETYRPMIENAIVLMESVLDSSEFYLALMEEIANSNGLEGELSQWKNAKGADIFKQLFPVSLKLRTYYSVRNVIGFGYPDSPDIFLNTKFLSRYNVTNMVDLMLIGSNLFHEHSHDCGFEHSFYDTTTRDNSVSYILNRAYERAFKSLHNIVTDNVVKTYTPWYKRLWRKLF